MKFYAIHRGRQTGVFLTWDDCKGKVLGYSNAKFRSFPTREQSQHYVETGKLLKEKGRTLEYYWSSVGARSEQEGLREPRFPHKLPTLLK